MTLTKPNIQKLFIIRARLWANVYESATREKLPAELMADFASLRFMMAYRTYEEYTGNDWQIEGAKIYFVTKEDHYNVVPLNSPCEP